MENPILDPPVPYIGPIHGERFAPGKMVRIQGTAPATAYRFDINLQYGSKSTAQDDVAVQVSVRILEGFIVLNSQQNGVWGEEQHGLEMPIKRADKFEVIIVCDFSRYKIAINGQHYCEFPQRIHYDRITHLAIDGDVSVVQISYGSSTGGGPPFLLIDNDTNDFEKMDSKKLTLPGLNGALPPPYGMSMPDNQMAPYPTDVPIAVDMSAYPPPATSRSPSPPPDIFISLEDSAILRAVSSNFNSIRAYATII